MRAGRGEQSSRPSRMMALSALVCLVGCILQPEAAVAQAGKVKISDLTDVSFGTLANLQADSRRSQSICVGANGPDGRYSVIASGTGLGGALELTSGIASLPYSVEWSQNPGQTSGSSLVANSALVNQSTPEKQQDCKPQGAPTASLTVVLRGTDLAQAIKGDYSGTLTILIAAE